MIRQAISCDLCGNEKRQTNHWFVAYEQNGELRVSGWNSRNRLRPGTRHLCGQTCLHKLVDDFMARAISQKSQPTAQTGAEVNSGTAATTSARTGTGIDASLTARVAYDEFASSARLITPARPTLQIAVAKPAAELVTMTGRNWIDTAVPSIENQGFQNQRLSTRNRHAEAWEREREREQRGDDCRKDISRRRMGSR